MKSFLQKINNVGGYKLSFIIFIFFLLFSPPFVPEINTGIFAGVVAFVLLITKYKNKILSSLKKTGAFKFAAIFAVFLCYLGFITLINFAFGERVQLMHYIKLWYRLFLIVPVLLVSSVYISVRADELKYSIKKLSMCFVFAVGIQFVLAFTALIFPSVKFFFTNIIYQNTGAGYLNIPWVMMRRGFGFCNSFVDSFGWGMGIIAALPLFFIKKDNFKLAYFVPILLFVSLVNARTGLIMAVAGVFFIIPSLIEFYRSNTKKQNLKNTGHVFGAIGVLVLVFASIVIFNPVTINWLTGDLISFVEPIIDEEMFGDALENLKDDSQTTTAELLFSGTFWNLPFGSKIASFFFGSGHSIYGAKGYPHSDVGYVNDIWMGGLVGCFILYFAFATVFFRAYKSTDKKNIKALVLYLLFGIILFQVKANAIAFCAGLNVTLPLLLYICYKKPERKEETENFIDNEDKKVSIIVPIYKVEDYIERCIESLLKQSYKNIEIILVNDGSPDNCPKICDEYSKKDSRIKVIHKENGGLSDARNEGIKAATGDYIALVDGDDFVHKNFVLALISAALNNGSDMSSCGFSLYFDENNKASKVSSSQTVSSEEAVKDILTMKRQIDVMAWNKLYKRSLFDGIEYPKGKIHEDVATTYLLISKANQVSYVGFPYYNYVQRKDSIVGEEFSEKRLELISSVESMKPFIEENKETYFEAYGVYQFLNYLTLLNLMAFKRNNHKEKFEELRLKALSIAEEQQTNPYFTKKCRIYEALLKRGGGIYSLFWKGYSLYKFLG